VPLKSGGRILVAVTPAPASQTESSGSRWQSCTADVASAPRALTTRRELRSREQFQSPFEIASVPVVLAHSGAKHLTVGEADQG